MSKQPSIVCLFLLCACVSTTERASRTSPFAPAPDPKDSPPHEVVVRKPWTERFVAPASLLADSVHIEGPQGMLDHIAVVQELDIEDVLERTTDEGYLQTVTFKPGVGAAQIRAHLDHLSIVALRKLTILERVRPCNVLVLAEGDAYYKEAESKAEQRGASLRLEGTIAR